MNEQIDWINSHARVNDPETSKAAAERTALRAGSAKASILRVLAVRWGGPMTFEEVARAANISESSAWKRLSDLKREGRVVVVDQAGVTRQNCMASRYELSAVGASDILKLDGGGNERD